MIAVDTNLLVYAHRAESEWHRAAQRAVSALAVAREPWAIPWPCIHEFLSVVTNPRIFRTATPLRRALEQAAYWMESPSVRILGELVDHWETLQRLVVEGRMTGALIHDARVAAICREHGVRELWSADRDFTRMSGFPVRNPLLDGG